MPTNLELFELKPEELHTYWSFLRRGLDIVKRKIRPNWLPEDIYALLRAGQISCVVARRGPILLGYRIYSKQLRPFTFEPEAFTWIAWELPLQEWLPEYDMPGMVAAVRRYVGSVAQRDYGTKKQAFITTFNRAKAFQKKYGWKPTYAIVQFEEPD